MIKQILRVKQIADQKFQRSERTNALSDELTAAEKRVDLIRESCFAAGKKLSACIQRLAPDFNDRRNAKKIPEAALAQCLEEWGLSLGESSILGLTLVDYARIQDTLASDLLLYKLQVEENVVEPLQNILNNDTSKILKCRKQLFKLTSEMDSAKSRYLSAQRTSLQASVNGAANAAAKAQILKEEMEDIASRVDQCRDSLTAEMFNLISREPEMSQLFVKLCQLQLEYHRKSFYLLESALPEIETQIRCCAYQPVFGISLEEHLRASNREIAVVMEACICWLLDFALEEEGLFRIGGSMTKIKKIKSAFDASFHHLLEEERDPHIVAGVLKLYLRSLPEPLLTYHLYDQWMQAVGEGDHDSKLKSLWNVVNSLPDTHFRNLRYLIKFLSKLCENCEVNKMSIQNVAIVIGPNLLWPAVENPALGMNMAATNMYSSIVDTLITYSDWFFPGECEFCVSTPTSPRHLVSFPLSTSHLSLSPTKMSNGDSALESMSSSPTNSSPKSPSPLIPVRSRKKTAPRAPQSTSPKAPISRSLSCGGFQAGLILKPAGQPNGRHSTLCVSHENLLNATYPEDPERHLVQAPETNARVMQRPKSRPKPPRAHRPPTAERRPRPSVPPPERPDSFSTSGSLSTDVSSVESDKVLDIEDISISFDSSGSESYNECQMSFADDSDNEPEHKTRNFPIDPISRDMQNSPKDHTSSGTSVDFSDDHSEARAPGFPPDNSFSKLQQNSDERFDVNRTRTNSTDDHVLAAVQEEAWTIHDEIRNSFYYGESNNYRDSEPRIGTSCSSTASTENGNDHALDDAWSRHFSSDNISVEPQAHRDDITQKQLVRQQALDRQSHHSGFFLNEELSSNGANNTSQGEAHEQLGHTSFSEHPVNFSRIFDDALQRNTHHSNYLLNQESSAHFSENFNGVLQRNISHQDDHSASTEGFFEDSFTTCERGQVSDREQLEDYSNGCHFVGGTPTWFDHYGEDKRQSSTMWFADRDIDETKNFVEEHLSRKSNIVTCGGNFRTIIEVGHANKETSHPPVVSGLKLKFRVNSETQDTKL